MISILTPVHNPPEDVLAAMLASVQAQSHQEWEHCLVDDGSTQPWVRTMLDAAAASDPRVRVQYRPASGGIVAASNDAAAMASGEFVALLDHDDVLHSNALAWVADAIRNEPTVDYLYTDEDKIDEAGRHFGLFLKPDWSPERMRTQMYTCHFSVFRQSLFHEVGGFRSGFDGSQDWDLVLRVTERARKVVHVREVAYHWRAAGESTAANADAKPYAFVSAARAVAEHIDRVGLAGTVANADTGIQQIQPALRDEPLVSIVIPTAGTSKLVHGIQKVLLLNCISSVMERSTYTNVEFIVVADSAMNPVIRHQLAALGAPRLRIVDYPRAFNFSDKVNLVVLHSAGEFVLLLNDDTEVLGEGWRESFPSFDGTSRWIERMLMYASFDGVAAVGSRMYFGDFRLQHTGVVIHNGLPAHQYRGFDRDYGGYFGNAICVTNLLAVTAACLMVRRSIFDEVGGFSTSLPGSFNDVDFCFKLVHRGYRNVYQPDAELLHYESASRNPTVLTAEHMFLEARWHELMRDDPYFHPKFYSHSSNCHEPPILSDGRLVPTE